MADATLPDREPVHRRAAAALGNASRRVASGEWRSLLAVGLLGVMFLGLVAALVWPHAPDAVRNPGATARAVAPALAPGEAPPEVEPVQLLAVDPDTARDINARVAFVTGPNPAARPFVAPLKADELQRAIDCLAAAQLYEAGNDPEGEEAVAQVVLNRVRHPAFPKTVCGVVFQGSERTTGCQFTFSCDGALMRLPRPDAWKTAREIATRMLSGKVFDRVGLATHYHTDWVVPYWSSTLDKLTAVKTHLFFRWRGWWGTPAAFRPPVNIVEPRIAKLAFLSDFHKDATLLDAMRLDAAVAAMTIRREGAAIYVTLPATMSADAFPAMAARLCQGRERCEVYGWTDPARVPPAGGAAADAAFAFSREAGGSAGSARWDCRRFARAVPAECAAAAEPVKAVASAELAVPGAPMADPAETPAAAAVVEPAKKRRIDPCRAMRNVDDRVGFCSGR